jgi:MoxR-like ATPase
MKSPLPLPSGPSGSQTAPLQPGRTDADFDAAKYTPTPVVRQSVARPPSRLTASHAGIPHADIQAINDAVRENSGWIQPLRDEISRVIVGQHSLVDRLLVGLISNGHILLEGVPGLAKTLVLKTLAGAIHLQFGRIQFTPDMLPADIVGTLIYNPRDGAFSTKHGPIFANLVLADEINRAPAKVQSALLEGMQERQVTIGPQTFPLPDPFLVTATMNPLDSDGTYALPLAQMDRFLVKIVVGYPTAAEEHTILERFGGDVPALPADVASMDDLRRWRSEARAVFIESRLVDYIVNLVGASRAPHPYLDRGASPRATLAIAAMARARALCDGRTFVVPDDVRASAPPVLRHRLAFNYRTLTENVSAEQIVAELITSVPVP